ncbi:MAG: RNA polymerase sigma-70 factor [Cytophagales bacterium]|nr:RNA polymerase sigma-70 factor [Cytophagales bacterium]
MGSTTGGKSRASNLDSSESQLIKRIKAGDEDAFMDIYKHYQVRLKAYALVITDCRYLADEMVQEVFLKIWLTRSKLNPELNFSHYIFKITRNLAFDHLKKVARNERLKKEQAANINHAASNSTQDAFTFKEYQRILKDVIAELPAQKRLIYELSRNEGKSNKEIAAELHLTVKTVQNHLGLALRAIKEKLKANAEIPVSFLLLALSI